MRLEKFRRIYFYLRIIFGLGLIGFLFYKIPFEQTFLAIKGMPSALIAAVLALISLRIVVSAIKLRILTRLKNEKITLWPIVRAYYIGLFFNNFVPTDIGGDIFKINELRKENLETRDAASAVIVERFTGGMALLILALLSVIPPISIFERLGLVWLRTFFLTLALILLIVFLLGYAAWKRFIKPCLKQHETHILWGKLYKIVEAFYIYRNNLHILFQGLIISFVLHFIGAISLLVLAISAGSPPSFIYLLMIIPVVSFVALLPISIGALGIREGALVFCLSRLGMSAAEGLSIALILRLCVYVHSGMGGLLHALKK